jgi:hypothetical protein
MKKNITLIAIGLMVSFAYLTNAQTRFSTQPRFNTLAGRSSFRNQSASYFTHFGGGAKHDSHDSATTGIDSLRAHFIDSLILARKNHLDSLIKSDTAHRVPDTLHHGRNHHPLDSASLANLRHLLDSLALSHRPDLLGHRLDSLFHRLDSLTHHWIDSLKSDSLAHLRHRGDSLNFASGDSLTFKLKNSTVAPNPVTPGNGTITVTNADSSDVLTLTIFSAGGGPVVSEQLVNGQGAIGALKQGLYIYRVTNQSGKLVAAGRFIVQ